MISRDELDHFTKAAPYNPYWHEEEPDLYAPHDAEPHDYGPHGENNDEGADEGADEVEYRTFDECVALSDQDDEVDLADLLDFTPLPCTRPDGWTAKKQRTFITHLATGACVTRAARRVGMSARSAYLLKARKGSASFNDAWDRALQMGVSILEDTAFNLAINGAEHQRVNDEGMVIHTEKRINASVLMQLLRAHKPLVYSHAAQREAVRAAKEEQEHAARILAQHQAERDRAATPPDPHEEAVRLCLAEDDIIKAAIEAGIVPDLSDENVARVADRMERIAPDQVTVIGFQLLEKRNAAAQAAKEAARADAPEAIIDDVADDEAADDDAVDGDAAHEQPLNRTQRRARDRRRIRAENRNGRTSYKNLKNGRKP